MTLPEALAELPPTIRWCNHAYKLSLTVNIELTASCPFFCGHCPVGSQTRRSKARNMPLGVMLKKLENLADTLKDSPMAVGKIRLTGGEPLSLDDFHFGISPIKSIFYADNPDLEIHTSGVNLARWAEDPSSKDIITVISRYHYLDACNQEIFRGLPSKEAPATAEDIWRMSQSHPVELSCTLVPGGVETVVDMHEYMEAALALGVQRVSFLAPITLGNTPTELFDPEESPCIKRFHKGTVAATCSCERFIFSTADSRAIPFSVKLGKSCENNLYLHPVYGGASWSSSFWGR